MTLHRLAPLALLLAYGLAFGAFAFGVGLPAFDDHPGQLYRLWHVALHGPAPWAWEPGWWAGYPELQFYPPGFFYLGWVVHVLSLGLLTVPVIYRLLLWLAYLAPGLTTFLAAARLLPNAWLALPPAFVALTLSAGLGSGVEGGVHIGMLPARLGWALLPLMLLAVRRWTDEGGGRPWLAAPLVALIVLTHPAHLPTALAIVLIAGAARPPRSRRLLDAVAVLLVGAALTAFWTLPLVTRLEHTRALAWGALTPAAALATLRAHPVLPVLALFVLMGRLARERAPLSRPIGLVHRVLPWVMVLVVAVDATLLEPLGFRWLPADRVADGMWLAFVLGAGWCLGSYLNGSASRVVLATSAVALIAVVGLSLPGGTLALWPRATDWTSYDVVSRGLRLPDLWSALRGAAPGRVLFVRSGVPLVYGSEWWRPHSHLTAVTPLEAGRDIIHGTFTHPSPVAAFLYRGDAGRGAITALTERLDGHALFGRPLTTLDAQTLDTYADRLGVSVIVVLDEDVPRLTALQDRTLFVPRPPIGPFHLWERRTPAVVPTPTADGRWRVALTAEPGAWAPARLTYYPLWAAERAGVRLQTRRGPLWDLEVRLDERSGPVELVYRPGVLEWTGLGLSAAALLVWFVAYAAPGVPPLIAAARLSWLRPSATATPPPSDRQNTSASLP